MNDVVIYQQDNSYTEYAGQAAAFTLTMTDGTQTEITAYSPFLVIDGVGYKTKHEPCEALSRYANELDVYKRQALGKAGFGRAPGVYMGNYLAALAHGRENIGAQAALFGNGGVPRALLQIKNARGGAV